MRANKESGVALISAMLVLMLMSALLVGFTAMMTSDQRASGMNRDQTQAYAAAHAGVEKLTTDLAQLFQTNFSPTGAQVNALSTTANEPVIPGMRYYDPMGPSGDGYRITFFDTNGDGNPDLENPNGTPIPSGPYMGLVGLITPYTIDVSAHTTGDAEVRMRRTIQTVAIPVFQFGIFSENDLSFFAGPDFNFGGRVHTNQNLYLGQGAGTTLTLADRVTAVGEVVRTHLSNGQPLVGMDPDYTGTVRIAKAQNCPANVANCRNLAPGEGSVTVATVPPSVLTWIAATPGHPAHWEMVLEPGNEPIEAFTGISVGSYNNYIRNGRTGATRLDLPIVDASAGTTPVDIIRRPRPGDPTGVGTPFRERFYSLASVRVLLSDTADDIRNLPGIGPGDPIDLTQLAAAGYVVDANHPPLAAARNNADYAVTTDTPLVTGFIKIERQRTNGAWDDVTMRILNLGFAGKNLSDGNEFTPDTTGECPTEPNPNAIIRFQRLRDTPNNGSLTADGDRRCGNGSTSARDYIPTSLYDPREGARREGDNPANLYLGGIMHYVELDVNNLRRWLQGATDGGFGAGSMNITGYVFYFSDRRGNRDRGPDDVALNADDRETGELGFEDFVNPDNSATGNNNGAPDTGENVNGNAVHDTYGNIARRPVVGLKAGGPYDPGVALSLRHPVTRQVARVNPPVLFRRALKIVNGARGQLPFVNRQGLTVAAENPVYVQGNYNACESMTAACGVGFDGANGVPLSNPPHVSAAVIADAVTLLSRSWNDIRSFNSPHATAGRQASTTFYRLGIISGKGLSFPRPGDPNPKDYGTDGGAHNFLRYIERWTGQTLNYRGSIVSLYINRQAVGTYKCCGNVYDPPTRGYNFEQEFLSPSLLPPRTPMFRDINTLTFRQVLRPTEP